MRKISQQAKAAFLSNTSLKISNTEVIANGAITSLYLFGNLIAEKNTTNGKIKITNAGWFSNTTKERLNSLPGVSIQQKNRKWYLNGKEWNGKWTSVNS